MGDMQSIRMATILGLSALVGLLALAVIAPHPVQAQTPYTLDAAERQRYGGTFGINFSHYDFDLFDAKKQPELARQCATLPAYDAPECSCTIDWRKISQSGFRFAYLKASDGTRRDASFPRNWDNLLAEHKGERLYRGAYHFLRPHVSVREQAETFLRVIGAGSGRKPTQLSPVLDVEWAWQDYEPGAAAEAACPTAARDRDRPRCDMWHTKSAHEIADMASDWIDIVERALDGPQVIIYTNQSWWNKRLAVAGREMARDQPIWISRYHAPDQGPRYEPSWDAQGGSSKWQMPPLPLGAQYPAKAYTVPHFWQFAEAARIDAAAYTCRGKSTAKDAELNWLPVAGEAFEKLFGAPRKAVGSRQ